MIKNNILLLLLTTLLGTQTLTADTVESEEINGNWHLRVMDGMEVRQARAILDFDMTQMRLSGFDSCNRISGNLIKNSDTNITASLFISTEMACRESIHSWVSKRLDDSLKEGFSLKIETKYGVEGITLKSPSHELFFKKMGK